MKDEMKFEGFPSPERNYFQMPNEWINICAKIDNLAELKVVQYVLRHTWGYHEYGTLKAITVDEFMHGRKRTDGTRMDEGTGLKSDRSVKDGIKIAIEHEYLVCDVDITDKARIRKSYALKMHTAEHGGYHLPLETRQVVSTPLTGSIYPSEVQHLPPNQVVSTPRSEKDTKERHSKKDTLETEDTFGNDANAHCPSISSEENLPLGEESSQNATDRSGVISPSQDVPQTETPSQFSTSSPQATPTGSGGNAPSSVGDVPQSKQTSYSPGDATKPVPQKTSKRKGNTAQVPLFEREEPAQAEVAASGKKPKPPNLTERIESFRLFFQGMCREKFDLADMHIDPLGSPLTETYKAAKKAIALGVSEEGAKVVMDDFWNEYRNGEHFWHDPTHLTYRAFCNGYHSRLASVKFRLKQQTAKPTPSHPGYVIDTEEDNTPVFILSRNTPRVAARR